MQNRHLPLCRDGVSAFRFIVFSSSPMAAGFEKYLLCLRSMRSHRLTDSMQNKILANYRFVFDYSTAGE